MTDNENYGIRIARLVWAAPASVIGLLLSPFFRRRSITSGIVLCEGAEWPRKAGWRYRAITFGHVVLSVDTLDDRTLAHEIAHVHQYERWGVLLIPAYVVAAVWTRLRGGHHHHDNPFEVAADRASRL